MTQSSSASRKWKNSNVLHFADLVHKVRRDPRVTLRKVSPDTTGHGLRITKLPAVWYFHISLWKIPISFGSIFSFLYNPQALLENEKIWTLSFSPTFGFFWTKFWILLEYCKKTVKWRTANVFTVKQLTICPGWLLRKTILEGFQWSGNFELQGIGSRRALHQGWKWAFNSFQNRERISFDWLFPDNIDISCSHLWHNSAFRLQGY